MDWLAGLLAALGGVAGLWAVGRALSPLFAKVAAKVLSVPRTLDADRERIVANLRSEIVDYQRRLTEERAECQANEAELKEVRESADRQIAELTQRLAECETFVKRYIGERKP